MILAKKRKGAAHCFLIDETDIPAFIQIVTETQIESKRFLNVAIEQYKGKKYNMCKWVVIG